MTNNFSLPPVPFCFVRHGETDWNKENRRMGQTDMPLNATGIAQAEQLASDLSLVHFASVVASPLDRALTTAEIIVAKNSMPLFIIDDLKECSWGVMEGQVKGSLAWLEHWEKDGIIEGAEKFSDFQQRVMQGLQKALELPGPVLIVSHGAVYWAVQKAMGLPMQDLCNCTPVFHHPPEQDMQQYIHDRGQGHAEAPERAQGQSVGGWFVESPRGYQEFE